MPPAGATDSELLIRIDERVNTILEWIENHDRRHSKIISALLATIIASLAALVGAVSAWVLR